MVESAALESTFLLFTNLPTMFSFRVGANNMAQAMIVPIAMSTEVDLVPVLDMVPLDHLPPFSLPSEADLLRLLHGKSPQPCQIKNRKSRCSDEGGCEEKGEKCVLRKMKESWAQKGLPLKERDDEIVNFFSKVKQRLQSLKKNVKKMSSQTKEKHSFSSTTVNLAPMNIQELIKSLWHLPARIKKSLLAVVEDYLGKNATR